MVVMGAIVGGWRKRLPAGVGAAETVREKVAG
jgi:hypothetical protein